MATKRMFSCGVIGSDAFCDLSHNAQLAYFHLGMNADNYGFISGPKKILRMAGLSTDILEELEKSGFILVFESGVIVITHWWQNNKALDKRCADTIYANEYNQLVKDASGIYRFSEAHKDSDVTTTYSQKVSRNYGEDSEDSDVTTTYSQKVSRNYGEETRNYGEETRNYGEETRNYGEETRNYGDNIKESNIKESNIEEDNLPTYPSSDQVRKYAEEIGHSDFDAQYFCDYYAKRCWKMGGNPMRDWRAAVRFWIRNKDIKNKKQSAKEANSYEIYDIDTATT